MTQIWLENDPNMTQKWAWKCVDESRLDPADDYCTTDISWSPGEGGGGCVNLTALVAWKCMQIDGDSVVDFHKNSIRWGKLEQFHLWIGLSWVKRFDASRVGCKFGSHRECLPNDLFIERLTSWTSWWSWHVDGCQSCNYLCLFVSFFVTLVIDWVMRSTKPNRPRGIRRALWSRGWSSSTFTCSRTSRTCSRFTCVTRASRAKRNWSEGNHHPFNISPGSVQDQSRIDPYNHSDDDPSPRISGSILPWVLGSILSWVLE